MPCFLELLREAAKLFPGGARDLLCCFLLEKHYLTLHDTSTHLDNANKLHLRQKNSHRFTA